MIALDKRACPFHDTCQGTIELWPEVDTEFSISGMNDTHCITSVTVTCTIQAQCDRCSFTEALDSQTRKLTFDQLCHISESVGPDETVLDELHHMIAFEESQRYEAETEETITEAVWTSNGGFETGQQTSDPANV